MFVLSQEEHNSLRRQNGTLKRGAHSKYPPMVFTEQGVAQLSSAIRSERAINVNIKIIRLFTKMRHLLMSQAEFALKIEKIENELDGQSQDIKVLFSYIKKLIEVKEQQKNQNSRKRITF